MNFEFLSGILSSTIANPAILQIIYTSIVLGYFIMFFVISKKTGVLLEYPNGRKNHKKPVPLIGGIVLFATLLSLSILELYDKRILTDPIFYLIFLVGLIDDLVETPYYAKLMLQSVPGILFARNNIVFFNILPENELLPKILSFLFFIAIVNAFNLIDGINGLLIGISIIYSLFSFDFRLSGILFVLIVLNFNEILFMGDSGSFLLAYLLLGKRISSYDLIELCIFFGYPIYEITSSFLRRLVFGKNPFKADRFHLHHIGVEKFGMVAFLSNAYLLSLGFSLISSQKFGFFLFLFAFIVLFAFQINYIKRSIASSVDKITSTDVANLTVNSNSMSEGDNSNF